MKERLKKRYVPLLIIIILISIFIVLVINNKTKKIYVYEVDIYGNDIMLKDFIMVASNNSLYIPNTYYLEKVGNSEVRDFSMSIIYNKKEITSWALAFDSKIRSDFGELFFKDLSINPNDQIIVRMKYKVDGKEKDLKELIDLKDCLKYSN